MIAECKLAWIHAVFIQWYSLSQIFYLPDGEQGWALTVVNKKQKIKATSTILLKMTHKKELSISRWFHIMQGLGMRSNMAANICVQTWDTHWCRCVSENRLPLPTPPKQ